MKKWGLVVTLFYGVVVLAFLVPAYLFTIWDSTPSAADFREVYAGWIPWTSAAAVMLGSILLLWLSADTTHRRLKPRTHILVSALTIGLFMAILTIAILLAFAFGVLGEKAFDRIVPALLFSFAIPWLLWGALFYRFCRNCSDPISRGLAWMFRGSVLELLIAVPAHIVMRRRHDCSAPAVNGYGIAAGISIMLLSFGPSVLLLFKKRMEAYAPKAPAEK
jgi:hypothetical protein